MSDTQEIQYTTGGAELLDRIAPLWRQLRIHHAEVSATWRESLLVSSFDERKAELLEKSAKALLVIVASEKEKPIAYCVASVASDGAGEIDSLFVHADYRRRGVANRLMTDSMAWFKANGAKSIIVEVLSGNDDALCLYEKFGFHPRITRLRHIP